MSEHTAQLSLATARLHEVMTSICVDGVSYALMLASPFDLEDFARGFALSEALIQHADELRDINIETSEHGFTLDLKLSPRAQYAAKQRRRELQGTTGCGLCGADAIAFAIAQRPACNTQCCIPTVEHIKSARERLPALQIRNREIGGGMHAAALFSIDDIQASNAIAIREDIGRHNALDKLIGATTTIDRANTYAVLTSRCSYELVVKCARAGIGALITFAVPTTYAVQCAQDSNITLACYHGPHLDYYHIATC